MSTQWLKYSYLDPANAQYLEDLYAEYSQSGNTVDESWAYFFDGLNLGLDTAQAGDASQSADSNASPVPLSGEELEHEVKVLRLIENYRRIGRRLAHINPLQDTAPQDHELSLSRFGLSEGDLQKGFRIASVLGLPSGTKLATILETLRQTYCGTVAIEIEHIGDQDELRWLRDQIEVRKTHLSPLSADEKKQTLNRLVQSETFERFLHTRYVAKKRFSIEGGESLIPSLDAVIGKGGETGVTHIVIGMAHRGRLNVLVNIFGKKPEYIFSEFEDQYEIDLSHGDGDVKYHKGYSADVPTTGGKSVHITLACNPSHLEFVNPVVEGMARAKQFLTQDEERSKVLPILIHGDAAIAGQGVVYETLTLSQLPGFKTGGTFHITINNQVGFTTDPIDDRSTEYCTDLAKLLSAPVFHINGDDPESMIRVSRLALEYRQKFKKDVFLDLVCYRKYGHNEGDEPSFTQPLMYKVIAQHPSPSEVYSARLVSENVISETDTKTMIDACIAGFTQAQTKARADKPAPHNSIFESDWKGLHKGSVADMLKPIETKVGAQTLKDISSVITSFTPGFTPHPKLVRLFEGRQKAVQSGAGIDWGNGELLSYASLLIEGTPVRLTGQDTERGTFTHRHAVLRDFENGSRLNLLAQLNKTHPKSAPFSIYNSNLTETGALGFEYGYSSSNPKSLVIWEAQFGDFANGAQVIIDQFIASAESKWQRSCGLVMLLPHGYEGQGPEHSSARLERFLQLCGDANMVVANLTTPANLFHAMRRQVRWDFRKPLVIMSPKSLLRHPLAVSSLSEFSEGKFEPVISDPLLSDSASAQKISRVIFCSGKFYYDLLHEREAQKISHVALVRIEQLYPWPKDLVAEVVRKAANCKEFMWAQEEPRNMGACSHVLQSEWPKEIKLRYISRRTAASPAVGSTRRHDLEQKELIQEALGKR